MATAASGRELLATAASTPKSTVLNSWKEIAAYLGRGVRTVQRYERELALPVRRPRGKSRSAVIALSEDLDLWLHNAPVSELRKGPKRRASAVASQVHEFIALSEGLREQCSHLRTAHHTEMTKLVTNLSSLVAQFHAGAPAAPKSARGGASKLLMSAAR
jgi:hypothetical protein